MFGVNRKELFKASREEDEKKAREFLEKCREFFLKEGKELVPVLVEEKGPQRIAYSAELRVRKITEEDRVKMQMKYKHDNLLEKK